MLHLIASTTIQIKNGIMTNAYASILHAIMIIVGIPAHVFVRVKGIQKVLLIIQ